jgi:ferredoxin--NADP+ reductase
MRIAIIGAGPSGFFTAGEILKKIPDCEVHMFEKRVAPFGLVRYGVSPDHQLTRRAIKQFEQIAAHPNFYYYGNLEIGADISINDLYATHHAVVICAGAEKPNRPDIPGSNLKGVVDALDFSRWVNGEGDGFDESLLCDVETTVIIGNGNVALDAARMMARPSADWVATDITPHAMEALIHHRIKKIVVVGRRGPNETSFSEAEWDEVVNLPGWEIKSDGTVPIGLLPEKSPSDRSIEFKFHLVAKCLLGDGKVNNAKFVHATSGEQISIHAQLVLFATGHRGIKLHGLPFDEEKGIIPNDKGAVTGAPGWFVCGWIKRGARGLIGVNRKDAIETVTSIVESLESLKSRRVDDLQIGTVKKQIVSWSDWKRIDSMESARGAELGRPRLNLTSAEALNLLITP